MTHRHHAPRELAGVAWPVPHARRNDGDAHSLFSTSPVTIAPSSSSAGTAVAASLATSAPAAAARFLSASPAGSQQGQYAQQHYSHHQQQQQPQQRPHHQRKKSVPWIPDSLAERCYGCHASFSLVLRRHHCRRCGNVFCDACSSARIPLVSAGFFTPVRVCEKCCVAAKKAHAKMLEDRMQQQLLQSAEHEPYLLFPQTPRSALAARSNSTGSRHEHHAARHSGSLPAHRRKQRAMTESVAQANGLFFHPPIHRSSTVGDSAAAASRRLSAQYANTDHLFDDRDHDGDEGGQDYRMQTLPGEIGMVCSENVRIRFMERVNHMGTLYITNYRIVFSPYIGGAMIGDGGNLKSDARDSTGKPLDPRFSADLSVNAKHNVKEDELPYTSDVQSDAVHAYQAITIVSVERLKKKEMAETDSGMLDIVCKDFRHVQFFFSGLVSRQTFSNFDRTFQLIRQYAFGEPSGPQPEFAKLSMEIFDGVPDGWKVYNPVAEFQRMGVSSSSKWRISQSNQRYTICSTYPSLYAVPATVSDSVLKVAAKFRSKNRIPALSWRDIHTGAVICRSSQPLVGLSQKQCDEDVFLIQAIAAANPSSSKLVIIDARPWKNAVAQKTVGRAGYEMTDHYETRHATASLKYADMVASAAAAAETVTVPFSPGASGISDSYMNSIGAPASASSAYGDDDDSSSDRTQLLEAIESSLVLTECKILFMGIENIHAMRKSYNKLLDSCIGKQSNEKWLDHLDSSHWMEHTSKILESAVEIVRLVKEQKSSVLIHCSDGWDRTAQLSSLAQLMMDPYYRTVQGFQVLIEKEWCSFGHKFRDRTGHGLSNASSEISPVFLQWIDCVWQIQAQFPSSFQFNERFLIIILDHLYSCRFGTFLYNSEKVRTEEELRQPTVSLWTYMNTLDRAVIENPFYHPHTAPRKKWKASVTATRQCYEIPIKALSGSVDSQRDSQQLMQGEKSRQREPRRYDAGSLVHTDSSSQMSASLSSNGYESDNSEAREHVNGQELDDFIHDMRSEMGIRAKAENGKSAGIGDGDFESEYESDDEFEEESSDLALEGRSSCFHKIIRDLDSGFSFPQAVEPSELLNFQSSGGVIRSAVPPTTSRLPVAAPIADLVPPVISATPPPRPSLSTLFTPMSGRASEAAESMWNGTEGDLASESDEQSRFGKMGSFEDVIIPCYAIKALHFWTRYYLRWDSAANFGRDASIEVEMLHRDLLIRFESLQKHASKIRQEEAAKWRRKFQRFQATTAANGGSRLNRSRFGAASGDGEEEMFSFDDAMSFHHPGSPKTEIMGPSHVDVIQLSLDQVLKGQEHREQQQHGLRIDEQIALLKHEHHKRMEQLEAAYQDSLSRLLLTQARGS